MSNTDQPVRACVLKVNVKCCSGCLKKAKRKLHSLPGVGAVEYNAKKGLMTVTGDVDPMTLVRKLTRSKKKTCLVSVSYMPDLISDDEEEEEDEDEDDEDNEEEDDHTSSSSDDTSSNHDLRPMERAPQVKKKKEGIVKKYLLLGCLRSKPKVAQPFPLAKRVFGSSRFGNGAPDHVNALLANGRRPPPGPPPPFQMMMQQPPPPPFQMSGAAPPMHMIQQQLAPLPYFMENEYPEYKAPAPVSMFHQPPKPDPKMLVNNAIHYSGK